MLNGVAEVKVRFWLPGYPVIVTAPGLDKRLGDVGNIVEYHRNRQAAGALAHPGQDKPEKPGAKNHS